MGQGRLAQAMGQIPDTSAGLSTRWQPPGASSAATNGTQAPLGIFRLTLFLKSNGGLSENNTWTLRLWADEGTNATAAANATAATANASSLTVGPAMVVVDVRVELWQAGGGASEFKLMRTGDRLLVVDGSWISSKGLVMLTSQAAVLLADGSFGITAASALKNCPADDTLPPEPRGNLKEVVRQTSMPGYELQGALAALGLGVQLPLPNLVGIRTQVVVAVQLGVSTAMTLAAIHIAAPPHFRFSCEGSEPGNTGFSKFGAGSTTRTAGEAVAVGSIAPCRVVQGSYEATLMLRSSSSYVRLGGYAKGMLWWFAAPVQVRVPSGWVEERQSWEAQLSDDSGEFKLTVNRPSRMPNVYPGAMLLYGKLRPTYSGKGQVTYLELTIGIRSVANFSASLGEVFDAETESFLLEFRTPRSVPLASGSFSMNNGCEADADDDILFPSDEYLGRPPAECTRVNFTKLVSDFAVKEADGSMPEHLVAIVRLDIVLTSMCRPPYPACQDFFGIYLGEEALFVRSAEVAGQLADGKIGRDTSLDLTMQMAKSYFFVEKESPNDMRRAFQLRLANPVVRSGFPAVIHHSLHIPWDLLDQLNFQLRQASEASEMAGVGDWKRSCGVAFVAMWYFTQTVYLKLFLALAFLNCATYVSAQGETGELGSAPACWINWPVEIISKAHSTARTLDSICSAVNHETHICAHIQLTAITYKLNAALRYDYHLRVAELLSVHPIPCSRLRIRPLKGGSISVFYCTAYWPLPELDDLKGAVGQLLMAPKGGSGGSGAARSKSSSSAASAAPQAAVSAEGGLEVDRLLAEGLPKAVDQFLQAYGHIRRGEDLVGSKTPDLEAARSLARAARHLRDLSWRTGLTEEQAKTLSDVFGRALGTVQSLVAMSGGLDLQASLGRSVAPAALLKATTLGLEVSTLYCVLASSFGTPVALVVEEIGLGIVSALKQCLRQIVTPLLSPVGEGKKASASDGNGVAGQALLPFTAEEADALLVSVAVLLQALHEFLSRHRLADDQLHQLIHMVTSLFFLPEPNFRLLEAAEEVLVTIFSRHDVLRASVLQEFLVRVPRLPSGKRARRFQLPGAEDNADFGLSTWTKLLLRLCQSTSLPLREPLGADVEFEVVLDHRRAAQSVVAQLTSGLLKRLVLTRSRDEEARAILDEFTDELLSVVFKPMWPGAVAMLRSLIQQLIGLLQPEKKKEGVSIDVREFALKLLSRAVVRLWHHSTEAAKQHVKLPSWTEANETVAKDERILQNVALRVSLEDGREMPWTEAARAVEAWDADLFLAQGAEEGQAAGLASFTDDIVFRYLTMAFLADEGLTVPALCPPSSGGGGSSSSSAQNLCAAPLASGIFGAAHPVHTWSFMVSDWAEAARQFHAAADAAAAAAASEVAPRETSGGSGNRKGSRAKSGSARGTTPLERFLGSTLSSPMVCGSAGSKGSGSGGRRVLLPFTVYKVYRQLRSSELESLRRA
ncbi:unnamed protein product, partial [Polarella glacialis]